MICTYIYIYMASPSNFISAPRPNIPGAVAASKRNQNAIETQSKLRFNPDLMEAKKHVYMYIIAYT